MKNKIKHTLATIAMVAVIGLTYYAHISLNSVLGDLNRLERIASMGMSHQPPFEIAVSSYDLDD
jgi:hypothetical protein|tara:strand:- start:328 stop:519 length:192 start_codon:yes stop_codon:yes gene_type:complete